MAPPLLLGTTRTRSDESRCPFHSKAPTSYRSERSPISANVEPVFAVATPSAVEIRPSIPLAPRLASTWTPSRGAMATSRSRIGIEFPTNSVPPSGTAATRSRAKRSSAGSSEASSTSSIARRARSSRSRQVADQTSGARSILRRNNPSASRSGLACSRHVARRSGSGSKWNRSTTRSRSADATNAWVARVVGVAPTCSTTSGRCRSRKPADPINAWPAVSAWPGRRSPDVGSASNGHPRRSASCATSPGAIHQFDPATTTPRAPDSSFAARSTSAASGSGLRSGRSTRPGSRAGTSTTAPVGTSGSSNEQLTCTGPGWGPPQAATASRPIRRQSSASLGDVGTSGARYARA